MASYRPASELAETSLPLPVQGLQGLNALLQAPLVALERGAGAAGSNGRHCPQPPQGRRRAGQRPAATGSGPAMIWRSTYLRTVVNSAVSLEKYTPVFWTLFGCEGGLPLRHSCGCSVGLNPVARVG